MEPISWPFDWTTLAAAAGLILVTLAPARSVLANDAGLNSPTTQAEADRLAAEPPLAPPRGHHIVEDHSGRKEEGKASIYSHSFDGRTMADGKRFDPRGNIAASKSLPLGTVAKVINLKTGESTMVKVEDHGPFVNGRVVDLTPHAARQIGLSLKQGVTPVIVAPVAVPQPNGTIKAGAGAANLQQASLGTLAR